MNDTKIFVRINNDGTKEVKVAELKPPILKQDELKKFLYDYVGKKKVDKHIEKWADILRDMWKEEYDSNSAIIFSYAGHDYEVVITKRETPHLKETTSYKEKFVKYLKENVCSELYLTDKDWNNLLVELEETPIYEKKDKPDFMPIGFKHLDGNVFEGNYRIKDSKGNIFVWVETREVDTGKNCREIVKGHYFSCGPVTEQYHISTNSNDYFYTELYKEAEEYADRVISDCGSSLSMPTIGECLSFHEQLSTEGCGLCLIKPDCYIYVADTCEIIDSDDDCIPDICKCSMMNLVSGDIKRATEPDCMSAGSTGGVAFAVIRA